MNTLEKARFSSVASLEPKLRKQIENIATRLPKLLPENEVWGCLLIGSCSRGAATFRSDIDLLFILKSPPLDYERVSKLRDGLEKQWDQDPLPIQCTFVLENVFSTSEPAMQQALKSAWVLWDVEGRIQRGLEKV